MKLEITLIENNIPSFQKPMEAEMDKSIKHLEKELSKIRSGRAHVSLIEDVHVACYGQAPMALKNIANLSAPEPRLLIIQPWDAAVIHEIEKAIVASSLGLTPANDGAIIRIQLPEMSSSRREDLVKILGKKVEECKVAIRNNRKDFHNLVRDAKRDSKISENFHNRLNDVLQKVTDSFVEQAEKLGERKRLDITTV